MYILYRGQGDGDSESEDENGHSRSLSIPTLQHVLDEVLRLLSEGEGWHKLAPDLKNFLATTPDSSNNNVLHLLANIRDRNTLPRAFPLVKYLVEDSFDLLQRRNDNGDSPLHVAIASKNHRLMRYLLTLSKDLDRALSCKNAQGKNCIHLAIEKKSRLLEHLITIVSPETLSAIDTNGNTPLHTAVQYDLCDKNSLSIIQIIALKSDEIVRKSENGDLNRFQNGSKSERMSPYTYHLWTRDRAQEVGKRNGEVKFGSEKWHDLRLPTASKSAPQANVAHRRVDSPARAQDLFGSEKDPGLRKEGKELRKQLMQPEMEVTLPTVTDSQPAREDPQKISDDIQRFLKKHYLRTRGYEAALEVLQGRDAITRKEIYLDLSNKSGATLSQVDQMIRTLEFEDVLQYMHIPKFKLPPESDRQSRRQPRGETIERIFQNDALKGVTTVLRIVVEDLEGQPHTDMAIEKSLRGKGVETWDWRKIDMCPEVIHQAAPNVRRLHLYWSGRNVVLRGWSEESGLRQLKHLEHITIHVLDSSESDARTKSNSGAFERRLQGLFIKDRAQEYVNDRENQNYLRDVLGDCISPCLQRSYGQGPLQLAQESALSIASEAVGGLLFQDMVKSLPQSIVQQAHGAKSEHVADGTLNELIAPIIDAFVGPILGEVRNELDKLEEILPGHEAQNISLKELDRKTRPARERMAGIVDTQKHGNSKTIGELNSRVGRFLAKELRTLEISWEKMDDENVQQDHRSSSHGTTQAKTHKWVECMKSFSSILQTALRNSDTVEESIEKKGEPIVVALIDDGVDVDQLLAARNPAPIGGRSFCSHSHNPDQSHPYYESSRGHGTLMAQQIYRVCPRANLVALKLKDHEDQETKRRCITPLSAAKAIRCAIQWNVHIISMSWTIRYPGPQHQSSPDFKELAAAVQMAQSKGILLFCSASDQGQDDAPTYPAFKAGAIFKIGGADVDGNLHTQVGGESKVDFIFPGDTMTTDNTSESLSQGQWFTGSSVATAFAAGLAAVILYCAQVRIANAGSQKEREICTAAFKTLKEHSGMETAFSAIGKSKKYLPVWEVFDKSLKSRSNIDELDFIANIPSILYPAIYSSSSS